MGLLWPLLSSSGSQLIAAAKLHSEWRGQREGRKEKDREKMNIYSLERVRNREMTGNADSSL
jgi:hypothetical protein